jgi:hypothetical protein
MTAFAAAAWSDGRLRDIASVIALTLVESMG